MTDYFAGQANKTAFYIYHNIAIQICSVILLVLKLVIILNTEITGQKIVIMTTYKLRLYDFRQK